MGQEFWITQRGDVKKLSWEERRKLCQAHPNRRYKVANVARSHTMLYSIAYNGSLWEFHDLSLSKAELQKVLRLMK